MIVQSKYLTGFYNAYNEWLESGAPNMKPFYRDCGLCTNLIAYSYSIGIDGYDKFILCEELSRQFISAGHGSFYPFGDADVYEKESLSKTSYLNPERIKWVKRHI